MKELTEIERTAYAVAAKLKYAIEPSIEFDDKPCMSYSFEGDEGAYMQAWVRVRAGVRVRAWMWVSLDETEAS